MSDFDLLMLVIHARLDLLMGIYSRRSYVLTDFLTIGLKGAHTLSWYRPKHLSHAFFMP